MNTNPPATKSVDIPLDILCRIAETHALSGYGEDQRAVRQDIKQCCLVNRLFAEAFQPFVFNRTVMSNIGPHRLQKQLEILTLSPHIGAYVRRLTLTMYDDGDEAALCSILGGGLLTNINFLAIMGLHWSGRRIKWDGFSQSFSSSIERLCSDLESLQTLVLLRLDGVPASVFANSKSTVASLYLCGSRPVFDFPEPRGHPSAAALFLNLAGADLSSLDLGSITNRGRGFFSRVRSLRVATSWQPEKNAAFDKILSSVGSVSRLEALDLSIGDPDTTDFNGPYLQHWVKCLPEFKGLKRLTLSSSSASLASHFVSCLPIVLESLDTSHMECFSTRISESKHANLSETCIPRTEMAEATIATRWDALNRAFGERQEQGKLGRLKEVQITICLGADENTTELVHIELRKLMREAVFLPLFPPEKLRVNTIAFTILHYVS